MNSSESDPSKLEGKPSPTRLWRILRLIPIAILLLAIGVLLILFLMSGMQKITAWYLSQIIPPMLGLIALITIGIYAIVKKRWSPLLKVTTLVALLALTPLILWFVPVAFPASLESTEPAATVRLPANEPLKVAWGGDTIKTNYHAAVPDQRWAYDLVVEPYMTGSKELEDYGCYGIPVIAPISGFISRAHDGEPDATPSELTANFEAPLGNHVIIQWETGTYLLIAHLKQGSVLVKTGDTVEEGQQIGACGNSGNTSEPHIHIHHQRQDPAVFPINFAEGLPLYFRDHDGSPMPVGGIESSDGTETAVGEVVQHIGK